MRRSGPAERRRTREPGGDEHAEDGDGGADGPRDGDAGGRLPAVAGTDGDGRAAEADADGDTELLGQLERRAGRALAPGRGLGEHGQRDRGVRQADAEAAAGPAD